MQGLGAALLVPSSLALLRAAYSDAASRARAVGAWGAIAGVGAASGPIVGGVLVGLISWRAVFVVNLPVGILALVLGSRHLPAAGERQGRNLDPVGQVLAITSLTLLTVGLIEGGAAGWASPVTVVALIAFVPIVVAFVASRPVSASPA